MRLFEAIANEAIDAIRNDPNGNLPRGIRCKVIKCLDEKSEGGFRASVILGRLTLEKVLPDWDAATRGNRIPYDCFDLMEKLSKSELAPDVERKLDSMWTQCDDLLWKSDGAVNALMVGFASIQLVRQHTGTWTGCDNVDDSANDLDIEPSMNDSYFLASCAYSGGAPWEDGSDPTKRREFWLTWIKEIASLGA